MLWFYRTNGIKQNESLPQSEREDLVDAQSNRDGEELTEDNWSSSAVNPEFCFRRFCSKNRETQNFKQPVVCGTLRSKIRASYLIGNPQTLTF